MTPPTIRAELACAVRAVNAAFARLPESAQAEIDPRTDPVEAEVDAAVLGEDRERALEAIQAWRDYWLDRIEGAGFPGWLYRQVGRHDAVGDLAGDAELDEDFPAAGTLAEYQGHLDLHGACEGAYDALLRAWHEWEGVR